MKKNIYSFIKYQIFILMLFVIPFMSGFANPKTTSFTTADKGDIIEGNVEYPSGIGSAITNIYYLKTINNTRLFCLSPGIMYYSNVVYNNPELISGTGIVCGLMDDENLTKEKYDWENLSDTDYVNFQKSLWNYNGYTGTCKTEVEYDKAYYAGTPAEGRLNVSNESNSFTKKGNYYVSSEIKVDKANLLNGNQYDLEIQSNSTQAFAVTDLDNIEGSKLTNVGFNSSDSFFVVVPIDSVNGSLNINVQLSGEYVESETFYNKPVLYKYTTTDTTNPENQVVGIIENHNYSKKNTSTIQRTFTLNYTVPTSTLTIIKTDIKTENPIAGVKFVLLDKDGNRAKKIDGTEVGELETNTEGKIIIDNLSYGNYDIQEVSVPAGYILNSEKLPIVIDSSTEEIVVTNVPIDITKISKVDSVTGNVLAGAQLKLLDVNGREVSSFTSTEEVYETYLSPGTYTLTEESTVDGYDLLKETLQFQVTEEGNIKLVEKVDGYELKDGIIYVYNTPTPEKVVEVPDTGSNMRLYFIIGGVLLTLGSAITIIVYRRKKIVDQI